MVKIINGEIVQDNDPRLRKTGTNNGNQNRGQRNHNINSLYDNNGNNNNENGSQTPNNPLFPQNNNNNNRNSQQQSSSSSLQQSNHQNPLDMLAKVLKIEDRTLTIPAISQLGLTESKIGLIYFVILGLLCLFFGIRTLFFGVFVYVIFKHSEKRS